MAARIIPDTRYQRYPRDNIPSHHQSSRPYYPEEPRSRPRNDHGPFVRYINNQGEYYDSPQVDYYPEYVEYVEGPEYPQEQPYDGPPREDEHYPWIGYVQTQQPREPRYGQAVPVQHPAYPYSYNRQEYERNQDNGYRRDSGYNLNKAASRPYYPNRNEMPNTRPPYATAGP
ncbi:hypothetical protein TKK_0011893 [Trichogramma kaykai]|uniref:Uncharacterized protein n=1 Tax=Trichogramma kaykai TaxID=54128 RepID=A0ABD2WPZ0_9HYME